MREYFLKCIRNSATISNYSQRTARLLAMKEIVTIELYCYWRLPDDGSKIVACKSSGKQACKLACKLGGWFHLK